MNRFPVGCRLLMFFVACGVAAGVILSLNGCVLLGVVANDLPPAQILPQYKGLQGQTVAVMVWAQQGIKIDWADLPLDTAAGLEHKLEIARKDLPKYLKGTTFPVSALSIVRFQADHPEWENLPITDIATQLHVSRLIYIEVNAFQTRSDASTDLYKGSILGSVKVIEVADGVAKIAYTEDGIRAQYPKSTTEEGVLNAGDDKIYTATLDAFTTELADRFLPHDEDRDKDKD